MTAFLHERAGVLAEQVRQLQEADTLRIGSHVSAGDTLYRVIGFDPVGAHDRQVYVEEVTSPSRYSIAVKLAPE